MLIENYLIDTKFGVEVLVLRKKFPKDRALWHMAEIFFKMNDLYKHKNIQQPILFN